MLCVLRSVVDRPLPTRPPGTGDPLRSAPVTWLIRRGPNHIFCCGPTCLVTLPEPGTDSEHRSPDAYMCRTRGNRLLEIRTHPRRDHGCSRMTLAHRG